MKDSTSAGFMPSGSRWAYVTITRRASRERLFCSPRQMGLKKPSRGDPFSTVTFAKAAALEVTVAMGPLLPVPAIDFHYERSALLLLSKLERDLLTPSINHYRRRMPCRAPSAPEEFAHLYPDAFERRLC
jgi:hypothetical protein